MSRITVLASVAAVAIAVLVTAACGSSGSSSSAAPKSSQATASSWTAPADAKNLTPPAGDAAQAAAAGKTLYASSCASCHGQAGKGDGPVGASLNPKPSDLTASAKNQTAGELFWKITEGKGPMPGWKSLSEQDRWNLVAFIQSLAN